MVTTELGACEWFVWDLRRSNLVDRGQLDQLVHDFLKIHSGAEPPALAEHLISQGILTQFQCERLLQGKTQGFVLGPFTLMDSLGTGSMGTVYKAQSKNDGGIYAVKVLPRRSMWNVRLARRKVRAFDNCKHSAIVPFVDVGTTGDMHYLAWPFIEGETLEHHLQQNTRLSPSAVAKIGLQIAEGLAACHPQGLIHGLIKPSNLMLTANGDIRILDFGIGCLLAETEGESLVDTMSTANSVSSGLDCASPESIMDPTNLTPSGDQYSLGCVMYLCLSGQYPFPDGSAVEKMMAHQTKQPKPLAQLNPDIPGALVGIVERLMQKSPEARFPNAAALVEVLRDYISEGAAPAPPAISHRHTPVERPAVAAAGKSSSVPVRPLANRDSGTQKRAAGANPHDTPRPLSRVSPPSSPARSVVPQYTHPAQTPAPLLPTRKSVMGQAQPAPASSQRVSRSVPKLGNRAALPPEPARRGKDAMFSNFGVIVLALFVGVTVWLLTRMLF